MSKDNIIKQLKANKPRFVVKAFFRFMQEGVTAEDALDIIKQVHEDVLLNMSGRKNGFDEQYEKELKKYTRQSDKINEIKKMSMDQLHAAIEFNEGYFPRYELCEMVSRKEEAIPYLLEFVKVVSNNPEKFAANGRYFMHIYAFYILAIFREKRSLPYLLSLLHEDEENIESLFGDILTERIPAIIAGVYDGNVEAIKEIIENKNLYCFTRTAALRALTILVLNDQLKREYVMDYFRALLRNAKNEDETVIAAIISECCDLHPQEAIEEIQSAYKKRIVDLEFIDLDDVKRFLNLSFDEAIEQSRKNSHYSMIDDITKEFENFFCFNDIYSVLEELGYDDEFEEEASWNEEPFGNIFYNDTKFNSHNHLNESNTIVKEIKIGRNDPCSCGSGKKYKKCCGK